MSFDPSTRPLAAPHAALVPRRTVIIACLTASALLASACGHKKAPTPPPSKVPQRVVLETHQRGSEAVLSFPYPTTTISGTMLPGISEIEIWRYSQEVPEFAIDLLAEEEARRQEAQDLLDELGLELYASPLAGDQDPVAMDPTTTPGAPGAETTQDPSPTEPPAAGETVAPTTKLPPAEPVPSQPPIEPNAEASDEPEETIEDSQEEALDDDGESGEESSAEGEGEGEGEESELTEEEELEIRIEAARTLLRSPPTNKSSFISATKKDFKSDSELVLTVEGDDISSALVGDTIVLRLTLPERPVEGPEVGYLFAVRVRALNGKLSDLSATIALLPSDTPASPQEAAIEAEADGVHISWSAEEDPPAGFRIYRRDAQARIYGEAVGTVSGTDRVFVDRQAIFGARYIYAVTALGSTTPLLESNVSSEHEIDYQDRFGPATPGGLVAFPETGRVRLLWTSVTDADLAGYEILRRATVDDVAEAVNSEVITRGQYLDESVASGDSWLYSVVAIDESGNRSVVSAEIEVRVP